ncbi:MAG TPA: hypothetical protein VJB65_05000 [Patescibacteria group bacterium]|nr:hypothetical protein [Patescibacteria group bacterium]
MTYVSHENTPDKDDSFMKASLVRASKRRGQQPRQLLSPLQKPRFPTIRWFIAGSIAALILCIVLIVVVWAKMNAYFAYKDNRPSTLFQESMID